MFTNRSLILAVLLLFTSAQVGVSGVFIAGQEVDVYVAGQKVDLYNGDGTDANCLTCSGASPPPYDFAFDFEETGTPTGITPEYGEINFDATPVVAMEGVESTEMFACTDSEDKRFDISYDPVSGVTDIFFELIINSFGESSGSGDSIVQLYRSTTSLGYVQLGDPATNPVLRVIAEGGSTVTLGQSLSLNTLYRVWVTYTEGTANNSTMTVAYSTTTTRPTSGTDYYGISIGGTKEDAVNLVAFVADFGTSTNCWDITVDGILLNDSTIGDDPLGEN